MPTPYYPSLIQTIQADTGEIAQLQYDIQNAPPAMREISTKLFNVLTKLTYHSVALTEELLRLNVLQRSQPAPARAAQAPAAQPVQQTVSPFPAPPLLSMPNMSSPSASAGNSPLDNIIPCDVAQVVITATGTRVIPPAGAAAAPVVLPPNTPVDLSRMQAPVPPPAPSGATQVVLPPGGALPPDVQAALAARQGT
jgi:hypothetical protein